MRNLKSESKLSMQLAARLHQFSRSDQAAEMSRVDDLVEGARALVASGHSPEAVSRIIASSRVVAGIEDADVVGAVAVLVAWFIYYAEAPPEALVAGNINREAVSRVITGIEDADVAREVAGHVAWLSNYAEARKLGKLV